MQKYLLLLIEVIFVEEEWGITEDEIKAAKKLGGQLKKLDNKLMKSRGEVVQLATEMESELDELIMYNFIKTEYALKFFEILMWEDFKFSTKIKLFGEIEFSNENIRTAQKRIVKELEELSRIRNKFAHRMGLVVPGHTFLIDKKRVPIKIDETMLKDYRKRCKKVIIELRAILISQTGLHLKFESSTQLLAAKIDKITSEYEDKDIRKKYQKNANESSAHK